MAPFTLGPACIAKVKAGFKANAERLKSYKEFCDFGRDLPEGAYEFMLFLDSRLKKIPEEAFLDKDTVAP